MDQQKIQKASEDLRVIRQLMERPIRCSAMSGLSAIVAGTIGLVGLGLDYYFSLRYEPMVAFQILLLVWGGVLVTAVASVTFLTRLRERKQGIPFWSPAKRRLLIMLLAPFIAGVGLTLVIAGRWLVGTGPNEWGLIPAIWMACYGIACWQVAEVSNRELRYMGGAFILASLLAASFQTYPYLMLGGAFGGFHVVYGVVVWIRHGG